MNEVITTRSSIRFPENNDYIFAMDHNFWKHIPSNVDFYPTAIDDRYITFIGNGYGIQKKHQLKGNYGNGSIFVLIESIPHLIDWCKENLLKIKTP